MSMKNLFDQFVGSGGAQGGLNNMMNPGSGNKPSGSGFPGGLAGGLAAGGIVSLLMGSKKARKYAGKAATIGGAAMLGGAAFKLYQNWQHNNAAQQSPVAAPMPNTMASTTTDDYQLTLIKAMIAAAKADGHIDSDEQRNIFDAVESMGLPADQKGMIFDLLNKPVSAMDIAGGVSNDEQKTEVYMVSCMVGNIDHPAERKHLDDLAMVLNLPDDLKRSVESQVNQGLLE
ncbi:MAG: DUF533 domain-containing protein [Pseudomonadota bacterium]